MNDESPFQPGARHFGLLLLGAAVLVCCGCTSSLLQIPTTGITSRLADLGKGGKNKEAASDLSDSFDTKLETPLLGEYISVHGNTLVPLRAVGLVVNLNGTGGNPPPSSLRSSLQAEMARLNVPSPSRVLASPNTALVVVTAYLPANVRKGQPFDVRVTLPPNTHATSLKGGYLLPTRLFEETEVRGHGVKKGSEYAVAKGPVLTTFGVSESSKGARSLLAKGSIPGGAISSTDRDLMIVLRKRFQSIRKSKQIADAVTARFQLFDRFGRMEPQAVAKDNAMIVLKPHPTYRNNFPRFHQVIRNIPLSENEVSRRLRMETLAEELLTPTTSALAAVQLEAIGNDAKPFLRTGLDSPHHDVQFFAAEALAYLQDPAGVNILKVAARDEAAFRVYALAALSIIDDARSIMALRELASSESLEARYGAVRALSELDDNDPSLNTLRFKKQFLMRQINSSGRPAVHLTRRRSPEVTIFGTEQNLMLPAVLNVGNKLRVIGREGDETVEITQYLIGDEPVRRTCSRRLVDIIRTAGEMGAAYPDIVQLIIEADRQDNLQGELGIDRLPQAGRTYLQQTETDDLMSGSRHKLGTTARIPGIFDRTDDDSEEENHETLDLTTFTQPEKEEPAETDSAEQTPPTSDENSDDSLLMNEDEPAPSPSDDHQTERDDARPGVLKRFLMNPFQQHSF